MICKVLFRLYEINDKNVLCLFIHATSYLIDYNFREHMDVGGIKHLQD